MTVPVPSSLSDAAGAVSDKFSIKVARFAGAGGPAGGKGFVLVLRFGCATKALGHCLGIPPADGV